ncbi:MAG: hypothetical protein ACREST_05230 [Steroidobacteraceae bacterium]
MRAGACVRHRAWIEGGEASKEQDENVPLGEWGAATAAPIFMPVAESKKFAAVTISTGSDCCGAVSALEGVRVLATYAPVLPLADCSMPNKCRCRFKKYVDRRDDEEGRRFRYVQERAAWYAGAQRRQSRGRRQAD